MTLNQIMFIMFSAVIVIFSILAISSRRILRAATYLLFVLVATAGFYYWLDFHFLAAVQLTLYAGGIVVLIIFSILLTSHISHKMEKSHVINLASGILVAVVGGGTAIYTIINHSFKLKDNPPMTADMQDIGLQLLDTGKNGYALPFEAISLLLLAALIGAIIIAKKIKS